MAKPIPTLEYAALLDAVAQFQDGGASIEQIEAVLTPHPSRRTLQPWLSDLIGQQRLRRAGQARGARYLPGKIVELGRSAQTLLLTARAGKSSFA